MLTEIEVLDSVRRHLVYFSSYVRAFYYNIDDQDPESRVGTLQTGIEHGLSAFHGLCDWKAEPGRHQEIRGIAMVAISRALGVIRRSAHDGYSPYWIGAEPENIIDTCGLVREFMDLHNNAIKDMVMTLHAVTTELKTRRVAVGSEEPKNEPMAKAEIVRRMKGLDISRTAAYGRIEGAEEKGELVNTNGLYPAEQVEEFLRLQRPKRGYQRRHEDDDSDPEDDDFNIG